MSANEKASEIATREIFAGLGLSKSDFDKMLNSKDGHRQLTLIARTIADVTQCDSLAEENQRLRGVLERIANWPEVWIESGVQMRDLAVEALKAKSDKASSPAD